jgi:hypothetical protein
MRGEETQVMKITNRITKTSCTISALLAAGTVMTPLAASAASLVTNLVVNPGFENVDLSVTSIYNAPLILDWGGSVQGFAYSHDMSGAAVPNFGSSRFCVGEQD